MIKLGCNWSQAAYDLIINKKTSIDYFKSGAFGDFRECFSAMRALKPILLHGLKHYETAGMKDITVVDFDRANRLLAECDSPHLGLHLSITHADILPSMTEADIYNRMYENIQLFKKNITVPLLVENIAETPQEKVLYDHYPFAEPEKINKVIHDNDVDLLLDITHAKITAIYKEWNIHDYLRALPLHRVREIHVNGSGYDEHGFPDDTHNAMAEEDRSLLEYVLQYAKPAIISLEYIGIPTETPEEISENVYAQLKYLNDLCKK